VTLAYAERVIGGCLSMEVGLQFHVWKTRFVRLARQIRGDKHEEECDIRLGIFKRAARV
jgi:hypothetical protein